MTALLLKSGWSTKLPCIFHKDTDKISRRTNERGAVKGRVEIAGGGIAGLSCAMLARQRSAVRARTISINSGSRDSIFKRNALRFSTNSELSRDWLLGRDNQGEN